MSALVLHNLQSCIDLFCVYKSGPVFGSKDFFSGLAIFMDTYSNHNGPHQVSQYARQPKISSTIMDFLQVNKGYKISSFVLRLSCRVSSHLPGKAQNPYFISMELSELGKNGQVTHGQTLW